MDATTQAAVVQAVTDAIGRKPGSLKEVEAAWKLIMTRDIEPLMAAVVEALIVLLPAPDQVVARRLVNVVETVASLRATNCGC